MDAAPVVDIIGNPINCFPGYRELYDYISQEQNNNKPLGYITVNNVHTMMEAYSNPSFKKIIATAYLSIPDGKPLEVVAKIKGSKRTSRLFGPTVMENFINWGRPTGKKHYLIGSSIQLLDQLKNSIEIKYPGAKICGSISPPFAPIHEWDNDEFLREINLSEPDFIWVGLGAPKQEAWMFSHHHLLKQGVMFGIGAGFDYLAGKTKHAPNWMKNASLEWLYRLIQEPKRLWKRYFLTIPPFIILATIDIIKSRLLKTKPPTEK